MNSQREMAWCSHCGRNCDVSADYTTSIASCVDCGKVLSELACFDSQRRRFQKEKVVTRELVYKNRSTKKSQATTRYKVFERKEMIWCPHCRRKGETSHDPTTGIINCVDCGKILFEDRYTKKATLIKDAPGGEIPTKCSYAIRKEPAEEDFIMEDEEEDYSQTEGQQESCDYSYDYDYEGGDEYDDH